MAGVGVALPCSMGQHRDCSEAGCRCLCHVPAKELVRERVPAPADFVGELPPGNGHTASAPSGAKGCPECAHVERLQIAKFCRRCGVALVESTFCPTCQSVTVRGDMYCWQCGGHL